MKGIDYVTETNTYRAFLPFNTPIRKIRFCPERDSKIYRKILGLTDFSKMIENNHESSRWQ